MVASAKISMRMMVAAGLILVGGRFSAGLGYDSSSFTAAGRMLQPAPLGHAPGKDNGPGEGSHNGGEECGRCHRPDGKGRDFTIAGTVYEDRAARKPLSGAEIILQDIEGRVISMTSNQVGNFWTETPIASNPEAVAAHGGTVHELYQETDSAVLAADARTWQYKAWVRYGDQVRPMVTIAPVGGASDPASRMSCNMHHAALGNRGGLWGTGKNTLSSYPESDLGFKKHVLPILRNKCAPCHIPGATITRMVTRSEYEDPTTLVDYSAGLDFTSYSGSSGKAGAGSLTRQMLDHTLRQPTGELIHPGGAFWTVEDADYQAIGRWISEGARDN
jgi:hypothetical protein